MKWKLTNRFLMTILTIVFIVIIANTLLLLVILYKEATTDGFNSKTDTTGEQFVRNFSDYLVVENGKPTISKQGIEALENRSAWIQILDENGTEIMRQFAPANAPAHYRPVDLIQHYKYKEFDNETTIFISNFKQFSYIIGIKNSNISRISFVLNNSSMINSISQYLLYIIIADIVIALLIGLMFGAILTKPLYVMIDSIQQLKNRNFLLRKVKRPGIYKQVFTNLQDVASALEQQEIERKKLEHMRNEWISNISHDMKTPLASIQGYAELLNDADVSEAERKEYAEVIERKSIYMRELIDDFNLTMKLRQHNMPLQLADVRIEKLVRTIIIDVLNDPQFTSRQVHFESTAPELTLQLDEHLMKRAILNFIVNALIHNPDDTHVTVTLTDTNGQAMLEIRDNGRGMSPQDVENVFERYYRGSDTENIRGTGLGTAIARDIIVAHGGEVAIHSEMGSGTTVSIKL